MKNIFRLFAYFLVASTLILSGCGDDDDDNPTDPGNGGGGNATSISGTIQMWPLGSGKTLKAQVEDDNGNLYDVGSSEISSNGAFSLQLSNPPAEALTASDLSFEDLTGDPSANCTGGLTASDNTAKAANLSLYVYDGANNVGEIIKAKIDQTTFSFGGIATWTYLDKPVSVNGTVNCTSEGDGYNYEYSITANLSMQQGWNVSTINAQVSFPDSTTIVSNTTLQNGEAQGMIWFFDDGSGVGKIKPKK